MFPQPVAEHAGIARAARRAETRARSGKCRTSARRRRCRNRRQILPGAVEALRLIDAGQAGRAVIIHEQGRKTSPITNPEARWLAGAQCVRYPTAPTTSICCCSRSLAGIPRAGFSIPHTPARPAPTPARVRRMTARPRPAASRRSPSHFGLSPPLLAFDLSNPQAVPDPQYLAMGDDAVRQRGRHPRRQSSSCS